MDATGLAPAIEARTGIPVLDSIACALWGALERLGVERTPLREAGLVFRH